MDGAEYNVQKAFQSERIFESTMQWHPHMQLFYPLSPGTCFARNVAILMKHVDRQNLQCYLD